MTVITLVSDSKAYAWRKWLEHLRAVLPNCQLQVVLDEPAPYAAEVLEEVWPEAQSVSAEVPVLVWETPWFNNRIAILREQGRRAFLQGDGAGALWIDCDTFPPPEAAQLLRYEFASGTVTARNLELNDLVVMGRLGDGGNCIPLQRCPAQPQPVAVVPFACTHTSRRLLEKITWADLEHYPMGEDGWFCRQASQLGFPPTLVPACRCLHVGEDLQAYGVNSQGRGQVFFPHGEELGEPEEALVYIGPNTRVVLGELGLFVRGEPVFSDHEHFEQLKGLPEFETQMIGRPILVPTIPKRW